MKRTLLQIEFVLQNAQLCDDLLLLGSHVLHLAVAFAQPAGLLHPQVRVVLLERLDEVVDAVGYTVRRKQYLRGWRN